MQVRGSTPLQLLNKKLLTIETKQDFIVQFPTKSIIFIL